MTVEEAMAHRQKHKPNTVKPMDILLNFLWNFLRPKLVNFRTSIMGLGLVLMGLNSGWKELEALVAGGTPDTEILSMAVTNIVAGFGLIAARDASKSTLASIGPAEMERQGLLITPPPSKGKQP
jgi:hypothetical protein